MKGRDRDPQELLDAYRQDESLGRWIGAVPSPYDEKAAKGGMQSAIEKEIIPRLERESLQASPETDAKNLTSDVTDLERDKFYDIVLRESATAAFAFADSLLRRNVSRESLYLGPICGRGAAYGTRLGGRHLVFL